MIAEEILKNLKSQPGVFHILPNEKFHYMSRSFTNQLAYFTGTEIWVTEDKYPPAKSVDSNRFQYLLADNNGEWSLYQLQFHTYTDKYNGTNIRSGILELVPYDSISGQFFKVSYQDL